MTLVTHSTPLLLPLRMHCVGFRVSIFLCKTYLILKIKYCRNARSRAVLTIFQPRPTNFELYFVKKSICDSLMFGLFPRDENSTRPSVLT